ncbi:MAG TPA: CorA family divalent cation transporter [Flavobacterium sp.]|jgi:magnesium transporter
MNNSTTRTFGDFTWTDIQDPAEEQLLGLVEKYDLDILPIRDSVEPGHLPKYEDLTDFDFVILRAYTANEDDNISNVEGLSNKVAFFYNATNLITIHRMPFGFLENLLISDRTYCSAYELLIVLFKEIVSTYIKPSQWQIKQIDEAEELIFLENNAKISLKDLYYQKAESRLTKKLLQMTQNVVRQIDIPEEHASQLQDVKDDLVKLVHNYEEVWSDANNLMNTYLSVAAQKNNDVVKLLTVFSAFFLPLTFIAGIYGMNFDYMPELRTKNGYFYVLGVMVLVCVLVYAWFKRKKIL